MEERAGRLREGLTLAAKYENKEKDLESWLNKCEETLSEDKQEQDLQESKEQLMVRVQCTMYLNYINLYSDSCCNLMCCLSSH